MTSFSLPLVLHVQADDQPTVPCDRCTRGTWTDSNGCPRRCAYCHGTGRVLPPEAQK